MKCNYLSYKDKCETYIHLQNVYIELQNQTRHAINYILYYKCSN
jgi:hypothetical protein